MKKILLAIHDDNLRKLCKMTSEALGYAPYAAINREDLIKKATGEEYHVCLMDANYEQPGSFEVTISKQIYNIFQTKPTSTKFMAISANPHTVTTAKALGIPAEEKTSFDMLKFLRE
jgi:CheY-like chemotaxis protein